MKRQWIALVLVINCCALVAVVAATASADQAEAPPAEPQMEAVFGAGEVAPESGEEAPESESEAAVASPLSAGNCPEHTFCAYTEEFYEGVESHTDCSNEAEGYHRFNGHETNYFKKSAVNNCQNRAVVLVIEGTAGYSVCMNPYGERHSVEYDMIYEGAEGSRC